MKKNSVVALITPFTKEGNLDERALISLIDWHMENGTNGLVLAGTTGEGTALSEEEKELLFQLAADRVKGKLFLIANIGTNLTLSTVEAARRAKAIGIDAGMAIIPYYNRPTFQGCMAHFKELDRCKFPFILYHHPGRTGITLNALQLGELAKLTYLIGIKEASGNLELAAALRISTDKWLFSGDDLLALSHLATGFDGSISIIGNVLPFEWAQFVNAMKENKLEEARNLFFKLFPVSLALVKESNPQGVKYALSLLGKCALSYRLPLLMPLPETQKEILEKLATLLDQLGNESCPASLMGSS